MKLSDLTQQAGEWLRGSGPMSEIVISSRIRLARNVAGFPFLTRCSRHQRQALEAQDPRDDPGRQSVRPRRFMSIWKRRRRSTGNLLVERHLISKPHNDAEGARGVAVGENETSPSWSTRKITCASRSSAAACNWKKPGSRSTPSTTRWKPTLDFAFHPRFGYLTACPTNVGTGIRVSVMLHLPALKLTGEIEKVFRAAKEMRLAVRGLYGEGTEATGDFYQIPTRPRSAKAKKTSSATSSTW